MADKELKPCPFCGEEAHLDRHDIFCDCGAKIDIPTYVGGKVSVGGLPTYEEARQEMIEAWNNRADAVPRSEVEYRLERLNAINEEKIKVEVFLAKQEVASTVIKFLINKKHELQKENDLINASVEFYDFIDNFVGLTGEEILAELEKKYIGE